MPIINYSCESCGKEFAKIFFDPNDAPKRCPVCDSYTIRELGDAFHADPGMLARYACDSCDSCDTCETCSGDSERSVKFG